MSQGRSRPAKPAGSHASSRGTGDAAAPFTLGPWWRRGISALLVAHLIIVIAVPLTIMRPSSRLAAAITSLTRPYIDVTQASHGYGFFAPEPGPSHLVEFRFPKPGEAEPDLEQIPDLKKQWPRLRYHRHFMLSEKLLANFAPDRPPRRPREPLPEVLQSKWHAARWQEAVRQWERDVENWQRQRNLYVALVQSYGQHLLAENGDSAVEVEIVEHTPPNPEQVTAGFGVNERDSYLFVPGTFVEVTAETPPAGTPGKSGSKENPESVAAPATKDTPIAIPGYQP